MRGGYQAISAQAKGEESHEALGETNMNIRREFRAAIERIKARGKKVWIVPVAFLCATGLLTILNFANAPSVIDEIIISDDKILLSEGVDSTDSPHLDNPFIPADAEGSQFLYEGIKEKVSCVQIAFDSPVKADTDIQLFCKLIKNEIRGSLTDATIKEGESALTFIMPEDVYEQHRVDILGETEMPKIYVSDAYTLLYRSEPVYDAILYAALMNIVFVVGWLFFLARKDGEIPVFRIKTTVKYIGIVLLCAAAASAVEYVISRFANTEFGVFRWIFITAAALVVLSLIKFRGNAEKLFLSISLSIGIMMAFVFPIGHTTWDEAVHYYFSVKQSFAGDAYITLAERNPSAIPQEEYFDSDTRNAMIPEKNAEYVLGYDDTWKKNPLRTYINIGHVPSGVFLFFARCMGLSFTAMFIFGRLANVLVYSLVVFFAIRKLKTGKYIMATVALLPTSLFLSANYGYDSWVTAFTMLGLAYFFNEIQHPNERLRFFDAIIMVGAFVLAMGPKPIYFPLMLMLYFIGKGKFENRRWRKVYFSFATLSILFVVASFVLPFLLSGGGGGGDIRGGTDVNASLQTRFILTHPFEYALTLLQFGKGFFSFSYLAGGIISFAYLDLMFPAIVPFLLLFIVAFTDRTELDRFNTCARTKCYTLLACAFAMALVFTVLYISYTPVGLDTINGVQPRYVLPIAFPFFMVLGSSRIKTGMNKILYSEILFGVMSFVLLFGVWKNCVSLYT
jgi:uncharacterized membrane protein